MQIKKCYKCGQLGRARKRFCPCCGRSMSGRVARELAYREGIERLAEVLPIGATAPAEACIGALAMTSHHAYTIKIRLGIVSFMTDDKKWFWRRPMAT